MGRKLKGAALRAKKRGREAVEEVQERQAEEAVHQSTKTSTDQALFVLDTKGSNKTLVPTRKVTPVVQEGSSKKGLSEKDEKLVERWMEGKEPAKLKELAVKGKERMNHKRRRMNGKAQFDLWGQEETTDPDASNKTIRVAVGSALAGISPAHIQPKVPTLTTTSTKKQPTVAVEVAKAGQSYHPDPAAYETVISQAVSQEVRRNQVEQYQKTPLSQGMSAETRALLVGDSDSEEESDNDEEEGGPMAVGALVKRTDKLTRAQRNKQKRLREEEAAVKKKQVEKKLLKEVSEIGRYKKEIRKEAAAREERKKEILASKKVVPAGKNVEAKLVEQDPLRAPTLPVALVSELKSSLRTLTPKGSLATDRLASLRDRKMAAKPSVRPTRKAKKRRLNVKGRKNNEATCKDITILG